MKIMASRGNGTGFTVGDLADVALGSTKCTIYRFDSNGDAEIAYEGYLNLAIRYPDIENAIITHIQAGSTNRLSIDI